MLLFSILQLNPKCLSLACPSPSLWFLVVRWSDRIFSGLCFGGHGYLVVWSDFQYLFFMGSIEWLMVAGVFFFFFFSRLVVVMRLWVWVFHLVLGLWLVYNFGGWGLRLLVVVTVAMAVVEWLVVEWVSWLMGYDWWQLVSFFFYKIFLFVFNGGGWQRMKRSIGVMGWPRSWVQWRCCQWSLDWRWSLGRQWSLDRRWDEGLGEMGQWRGTSMKMKIGNEDEPRTDQRSRE